MTDQRWSKTCRSHGRFGGECQGSWSGRGRGCGCMDFSLEPSSNRCYSLVQRCGCLPHAWDGYWGVSNARWSGDWRGGFHVRGWKESGSTPQQRRWERRWSLRQWKTTFGEGRINLFSILQRNRFWTYARQWRGSRGNGWGFGGGNRREFTWKGQGIQRRRWHRRERMGWRNKGGGLK